MSRIRTFVAAEISSEVRSRAVSLIDRLRESNVKASWARPENIHLTLKFLGDVEDRQLPEVCGAVAEAASKFPPLLLEICGLSAFPREERPRTVWLGVGEASHRDALIALQGELESNLADIGFRAERRSYLPHLTLGRVRGSGPEQIELGRLIKNFGQYVAGKAAIEEVVCFASYLEAAGPTYQPISRSPLSAPSGPAANGE